jgi:hypothetical protein
MKGEMEMDIVLERSELAILVLHMNIMRKHLSREVLNQITGILKVVNILKPMMDLKKDWSSN